MSDRPISPNSYGRRIREPRSEPWMIEGLKLMERERKAAKINKINLEKEQLLFQKQARREARSRTSTEAASAAAASAQPAEDDIPSGSGDSMDDSDDEYPASQWRYMERKHLRETQGTVPKPRNRQRGHSSAKDKMKSHETPASKDEAGLLISSNNSASTTETQPEPQLGASAEPTTLAVAEEKSELGGAAQADKSSETNEDGEEEPKTIYVNPITCTPSTTICDIDSDFYFISSTESERSGSYDDDYDFNF